MEKPLVVLYTANLRGDLDLLPRLHTFLRQLQRHQPDIEHDVMVCMVEPVSYRTLLLDLGNSCAPGVWHCDLTGGRSTLMVMDAMGYHAAHVAGFLSADGRTKLEGQVSIALVDVSHTWQDGDIFVTNGTRRGQPPTQPYSLHIVLSPATTTRIDGNTLHLVPVNAGQVGMAQVASVAGKPSLVAHEVFDLPPNTPPDPTIAATVEFVVGEARYYQKKQG